MISTNDQSSLTSTHRSRRNIWILAATAIALITSSAQAATLQRAEGESIEGTIRCTTSSRIFLETGNNYMEIVKKSELTEAGREFVSGWEEANLDWSQLPVKFDRVPDLQYRVQPDREAVGDAANQIVMIALLLNEDGTVHGAFVRDSTDGRLNQPTIEAVSRWKFTPAVLNSKPTRGVLSIPVQF